MNNQHKVRIWVCKVCGYRHIWPTPPEKCPKCGVGSEQFKETDT